MQFGGCPDLFPIQLYHLGHWYQQHSSKNSNIWNGKLEHWRLTFTIIKRKEETLHMVRIFKPPSVIMSVSLSLLSEINGCFPSRPFSG